MQRNACKSDRSRQKLSNECLVSNFGFDTAEDKSSKICEKVVRTLDRLSNDKQRRYFTCADNHGIFVRMDQNQVPTALACHEHHPARANSRFWNTRADRSRRPVNEAFDAAAKHSFRFHRPNYHFRPSSKTSDRSWNEEEKTLTDNLPKFAISGQISILRPFCTSGIQRVAPSAVGASFPSCRAFRGAFAPRPAPLPDACGLPLLSAATICKVM